MPQINVTIDGRNYRMACGEGEEAHLTGLAVDPDQPGPLTPTQVRAFTSTLQALLAMPDFLALHAQAGRVAAAWDTPDTNIRSAP